MSIFASLYMDEDMSALVGLRHFRAAKKAQTITGQRVNLDL
ncbi:MULTISPECIES: hypothetical protein [Microcystis]|nr:MULTISPECIES: hypothetical protein [Microcystis]